MRYFTDDTNIFFSGKDISTLNHVLNNELEKVAKWLIANQLSINLEKTNYIIFKSRQKKLDYNKFSIQIKNASIERKESTKFLGVIDDEHLGWKDDISAVASKISKSIRII